MVKNRGDRLLGEAAVPGPLALYSLNISTLNGHSDVMNELHSTYVFLVSHRFNANAFVAKQKKRH